MNDPKQTDNQPYNTMKLLNLPKEPTKSQKQKMEKNPITGYWPSQILGTYTHARVREAMRLANEAKKVAESKNE